MKKRRSHTLLLTIFIASATTLLPAYTQAATHKIEENSMQNSVVAHMVPSSHKEAWSREVSVDGEAATLTRYVRKDDRNGGIEGEHFSTLIAANGTLKGFANISLDLVNTALPSPERSEEIARVFLTENAPELLPRMKVSWVKPHDEPIMIERNDRRETVKLTGMKVKARNLADGLWFWVIVGADEQPMIFERDITWITFPGHRKTEKWLHDSWLKDQL
ncbi:MAG: hypothetical protein ACTMHT_00295 [Oceanisphaera sp.]